MRPYHNPDATFFNGLVNYGYLLWALTVRALREESGGAAIGVLRGILMALSFCLIFFVIIRYFRMGHIAVRGDLMLFILIGVGFFFTMRMALASAMKAMTGSWQMTAHPHLSPVLFVYAESLAVLYNWSMAILIIYIANGLMGGTFELQKPIMVFPILILCWLTGMAAGMVIGFLSFYFSWFAIIRRVLFKLMFFTSGKFHNANLIPSDMLVLFKWNPIFHLIDQMRDAAFVNYTAKHTNMVYPTVVCFLLLVLGHLLHDFMLRRRNVMSG